jgi:hypothetical protein
MADSNIPALPHTRAVALVRIRRERVLPVRGDVVVTIGSRVDPLDIVVRTSAVRHLRPVPLARYLHLSETALPKYLLKKPGDEVAARDILAAKPEFLGMLQRIYRAPGAGHIAALQGSWMAVDLADAPIELNALYRGSVVNVMPNLGVVIEAMGTLVQGVWGGGGEGYGILKQMTDAPSTILTDDKVDVGARGAILLAGAGVTEQALRRAAQEHAAGLIVGGLSPRLKGAVTALALPTLVTEGFGERPMAAPIFELLSSHLDEETSLNTVMHSRNGAVRPEIFIPLTSTSGGTSAVASPIPEAQIGARVRIVSAPRLGEIGKIVGVPTLPQTLEGGVSAWGAEIELTEGDHVFVPWENLELIG